MPSVGQQSHNSTLPSPFHPPEVPIEILNSPSVITNPQEFELDIPCNPTSNSDIVSNKGARVAIGSIIDTGEYYYDSKGNKIHIRRVK